MNLLVHSRPGLGIATEVTPESAGWGHVGFRLVRLAPGESYEGCEQGREACLVLVSGGGAIRVGDVLDLNPIGGRDSPFVDAAPGAVYVPAGMPYRVHADTAVELAVCTAPGTSNLPPRLIAPEAMPCETRGSGANTRYVRNILPETAPADGLLVVEVITPGGNWSSYPPHKHDCDQPGVETQLEETYYHRLARQQGFAFQRVYTSDGALDEAMTVGDGDVVMVPRGYHPVGAAHGYDLYYLNVMAGPKRQWLFTNDPDHDWIVNPS
jgi:5-deoxy-glucuronate isomerase